jgi:hypothetical protein
MKLKLAVVLGMATLVGCASPTVVQSVKPNDNTLSCAQLQNEFNEADQFKKDADSEKGVTGGNALRLLFWPAIIKTQMNANEAIAAADNRKVHIANLMSQKNCPAPVSAAPAATATAPATAASAPAK